MAAALGVAALLLRVGGLTSGSLYRDDAWVALAARTDLVTASRLGLTIPGFATFHALWGRMGGSSAWAQLPQLAASVATVMATYLVARRLRCDRVWALAGAGSIALSAQAIVFATRVKPYSMDSLSAVAVIALACWVVQRPSGRRWLVFAVANLLAAVWSASVVPVTTAATAWAAWRCLRIDRSRRAAPPGPADAPVASTGVWWWNPAVIVLSVHLALLAVAATVIGRATPPPLHDSWNPNYVDDLEQAWRIAGALAEGLFHRGGSFGAVVLVAAATVVVWRRPRLAGLLVGPTVLAFALAAASRVPLGGGRIDIYLYPSLALTLAVAAQEIGEPLLSAWPRRATTTLVASGLVAIALVSTRHVLERSPYPGSDMADLVRSVDEARGSGDGVVVAPYSRFAYANAAAPDPTIVISERYSTRFTVSSPDPDVFILPAEYYETGYDPDAALRFARHHERIWYIATDTPPSDTLPALQAYEYEPEDRIIAAGYRVERTIRVRGAHADLLVPV